MVLTVDAIYLERATVDSLMDIDETYVLSDICILDLRTRAKIYFISYISNNRANNKRLLRYMHHARQL